MQFTSALTTIFSIMAIAATAEAGKYAADYDTKYHNYVYTEKYSYRKELGNSTGAQPSGTGATGGMITPTGIPINGAATNRLSAMGVVFAAGGVVMML